MDDFQVDEQVKCSQSEQFMFNVDITNLEKKLKPRPKEEVNIGSKNHVLFEKASCPSGNNTNCAKNTAFNEKKTRKISMLLLYAFDIFAYKGQVFEHFLVYNDDYFLEKCGNQSILDCIFNSFSGLDYKAQRKKCPRVNQQIKRR